MHSLYVLRSLKDMRLYTGVAADVSLRLKDHNRGKVRSTRHRRPLVLVYQEDFPTRADALARERYFKTAEGGALKQRRVQAAIDRSNEDEARTQEDSWGG